MAIGLVELLQKPLEVPAREPPIERLRCRFPVVLEVQQTLRKGVQIWKVIRHENLSLHDREIDLHLVEPTGVSGRMDKLDSRRAGISLT